MDDLLDSLERLGWSRGDSWRNLASRLKDLETSQFGQGHINLGRIVSPDISDNYIPKPLSAPLPANVQYARGDICYFTPSLIALTLEFVFDEEVRWAYQKALHQNRESYVTPTETAYRIHDPENQKRDHIDNLRRDAAQIASQWIENNVPGLFASGLLQGEFPTCEFVTLRKAKPFPLRTELDGVYPDYLSYLGIDNSFDAWESTQYPGLRLAPSARASTIKHHAILSINESNWAEKSPGLSDDESRDSRIYWLHMTMTGILGIWAILSLLRGYADHFKELRRSTLLGYPKDGQVEDALQEISESLSYSVDISAVTSELASYMQRKISFGFDIEIFKLYAEWPSNIQDASLWGNILNQIGEYSEWLQAMDNSLRDQMTQYGNLLGLLEDIRLQKRIKRLTSVLTFLTIVLAVLTVVSVFDIQWSDIAEFLTKVGKLLTT